MKNYKILYDKAKEIIAKAECFWKFDSITSIRKLKSELHQLEAEIEKEEQPQPEKTAEEYLKKALGGNMNISTLKLKFWGEIMEEYAAQFQQPQGITMWDVNHLGARELLIDFMAWYYDDVGGIDDYTIKHIDEYIEHRKREQEAEKTVVNLPSDFESKSYDCPPSITLAEEFKIKEHTDEGKYPSDEDYRKHGRAT